MAALIIETENSKNLKLIADLAKQLGIKVKSVSAYLSSPLIVEASNPDSVVELPKIYFNYNNL